MIVTGLEGQTAVLKLSEDDIDTLQKYARREEIPIEQALSEACNNGIEEIAFDKG